MRKLTIVALSSLTLSTASLAQSSVNALKGDFPFNETIHIIQQPAINRSCPTSAANLTGSVSSSVLIDTGIFSFDGKGNLNIKDSGMLWPESQPLDPSQIVPVETSCTGTYNFLDATTVDLHYKCSSDNFASYFVVHTTGKVTQSNILVEVPHNSDGSLQVSPFVRGGYIASCAVVGENTVISRLP
jgi:hypothetical protein